MLYMVPETTSIMGVGGPQFNKTEVAILEFLISRLHNEYSIAAISKGTKRPYPIIRKNVLELERKHILRIKRINPTQTLCSLAIDNPDNLAAFAYMEFLKASDFFSRNREIKSIADDILKRIEGNSFTLIVFGSQVKGRAKQESDIDLLFLVSSIGDQGRMLSAAEGAGRLTNREIHPTVMTYSGFFSALDEKSQNLPKEIRENHIIAYGAEAFYRGLIANA